MRPFTTAQSLHERGTALSERDEDMIDGASVFAGPSVA